MHPDDTSGETARHLTGQIPPVEFGQRYDALAPHDKNAPVPDPPALIPGASCPAAVEVGTGTAPTVPPPTSMP
ncbi:hypothetical protein [Streptomyces sp. NPDC001508]|uniref:hypothetical protein n=1 Tax=Streptomyces sp. NPDC001508 TaxID=3154656 RepID=UPI003329E080